MPISKFLSYNEAITVIEAQEMLLQMQISDYPHNKGDARRSFHKKIFNLAYPNNKESKILKSEDIALLLGQELS